MHAVAEAPPADDGAILPPPQCLSVDVTPPPCSVADEAPSETPVIIIGPSSRPLKIYSSTAAAIANFKPTPREIINGIAPHVFDDYKRRHGKPSRSHSKRRPPAEPRMGGKPSPLRGSAVISCDECSIYVGTRLSFPLFVAAAECSHPLLTESEQRVREETGALTRSGDLRLEDECPAVPKSGEALVSTQESKGSEDKRLEVTSIIPSRPPPKHDKIVRWRKFRFDILKCVTLTRLFVNLFRLYLIVAGRQNLRHKIQSWAPTRLPFLSLSFLYYPFAPSTPSTLNSYRR
jgi:hypothetical protein